MSQDKPHDSLFRYAFSDPATITAHFQAVLPPEVVAALDWPSLRLQPGSYVDETYQDFHSDLLFKVDTRAGEEVFLYLLFEHQSSSDPLMAQRVLTYMIRVWDFWLRGEGNPRPRKLPPVLPVILFHGTSAWTAPTRLSELLLGGPELKAAMGELVPEVRYILQDLSAHSDEQLFGTALGRMVQILFKHARRGDLWEHLARWSDTVTQILQEHPDGLRAVEALVRYIVLVNRTGPPEAVRQTLREKLSPEAEESLMTYAEQLREEGRQEIRSQLARQLEEERRKALQHDRARMLRLLQVKFGTIEVDIIQQIQDATEEQLDAWHERLLTAASLAEVFAG